MYGRSSRDIVEKGIQALINLDHRGAAGAEKNTGDGAGILIQIPDAFYRTELAERGITLPEAGAYATGIAFLPQARMAIWMPSAQSRTSAPKKALMFSAGAKCRSIPATWAPWRATPCRYSASFSLAPPITMGAH